MNNQPQIAASFRDPSGFLFKRDGVLYRQINQIYKPHYEHLMANGLYDHLVARKQLIAHKEVDRDPPNPETSYKIIQPDPLDFISYPYEWSFSQLKDAALLTLETQKMALGFGMILKDSSAYNVQFPVETARPILIDTLSFEIYQEGAPWIAYRQYCQHFLAPLALMTHTDERLNQLLRVYIDGVPLDLASRLLPKRTLMDLGLLSHIHLHARAQQRYSDRPISQSTRDRSLSRNQILGLIETLERTTRKLTWRSDGTEWENYYSETNYSDLASKDKMEIVTQIIEQVKPQSVWDMGANIGLYSRIPSRLNIPTVAFDIDPGAVERNYQDVKENQVTNLLPLVLDLTNPSPAIGWHNRERLSLSQRTNPHLILALALIHHLAIANNLPLAMVAEFFSSFASWLVIEFVPKVDTQVQRMLASREDIFTNYTTQGFETAFQGFYRIITRRQIRDSERSIYLMKRRIADENQSQTAFSL